jgi:hypothetical protein
MPYPSEMIENALRVIEKAATREDFGPKIKDRISNIQSELKNIVKLTKELEELVVLAPEQAELPSGMERWKQFPAGAQHEKDKLLPFVQSSSLLDSLYRKGIDIYKIYKFNGREIGAARRVGDKFSEFSEVLSALRRSRKSDEKADERTALLPCNPESAEFVKFLETEKVLEFKKFLIKSKEEQWKPFKREWFSKRQETSVLAVFTIKDAEALRFLQGEWLNAYVYNIMQDHFSRNQAKFELYTNVSYRAPADVIRIAGEFDVLGRLGNRLICVECKSGRLLTDNGVIASVVTKISDLKKAIDFASATPSDFIFYLIFDHTLNDETKVRAQLENSGIKALRPDQVRAEITRMI